ncbi:MAG: hypothetical protein KAY24_08410 [Candidatus Eisenbacteria sp.]|nr:hypothetical protein [Candidatus Eisenbacteria bacterium]
MSIMTLQQTVYPVTHLAVNEGSPDEALPGQGRARTARRLCIRSPPEWQSMNRVQARR